MLVSIDTGDVENTERLLKEHEDRLRDGRGARRKPIVDAVRHYNDV
jgi:hypothetical protein